MPELDVKEWTTWPGLPHGREEKEKGRMSLLKSWGREKDIKREERGDSDGGGGVRV